MTARIERVSEGYVVKTPKTNPYAPHEEERDRTNMRIEAEVYQRLGPGCPYTPKMLAWDTDTCCLSLEYLEKGNLALYVRGRRPPDYEEDPPEIEPQTRRRWTLQATRALQALHTVGVIHCGFAPRNFLIDDDLNLRISDFAGSSVDGAAYEVCAGTRFTAPGWKFSKTPDPADDIFSLGSVLYVVMTSQEPYHDVADETDTVRLYEARQFPDVSGIVCGPAIRGCWDDTLTSANQVLDVLVKLYGEAV